MRNLVALAAFTAVMLSSCTYADMPPESQTADSGFSSVNESPEAVGKIIDSVQYDPQSGALSFTIPDDLDSETKLSLQVSGQLRTKDGTAEWGAFQKESIQMDWERGRTYQAKIPPDKLESIDIAVALLSAQDDTRLQSAKVHIDSHGIVTREIPISERVAGISGKQDLFSMPIMNEQQRLYCKQYLSPVLASGILMKSWNAQEYQAIEKPPSTISPSYLMLAFEDLSGRAKMAELRAQYGSDFPAHEVETVLCAYFPFSVKQLQTLMKKEYNPNTNSYHYEGGRRSNPMNCAITNIQESDSQILITYSVYSGYSGMNMQQETYFYKVSGVLTLKKDKDTPRYWSVQILGEEESPLLLEVNLWE